jgi:hypothetical protein
MRSHHVAVKWVDDFAEDGSIKVGDVLYVGAFYNTTAHMLMEARGKTHAFEPIMGISRACVGE